MSQDPDPYGAPGDFTPYQPDATPDSEPADDAAATPFVPYGGQPSVPAVPYGQALGSSTGTPFVSATPSRSRWVGWVVGIGVIVATCGGGFAGVVGALTGGDDDSTSDAFPSIEIPSIEIPTIEIPSIDLPSPSMQTEVFANDLQRDQCLIGAGFDPTTDDPVTDIEVVPCAGAHDAQVLEINVLDQREASSYDFDDDSQVQVTCTRLFSRAQKELFEGSRYFLLAFTQTRTPVTGDKVACLVVRADGGSIRGFLPK